MFAVMLAAAFLAGQPAAIDESHATEAPADDAMVEDAATCADPDNCAHAEAVAEEGADAAAAEDEARFSDPNREFVAFGADDGLIFARTDTKRSVGNFQLRTGDIQMWFDTDYPDGRQRKSLMRFMCQSRRFAVVSYVDYDKSGNVTRHRKIPSASFSAGTDVIPDSIGEALYLAACDS